MTDTGMSEMIGLKQFKAQLDALNDAANASYLEGAVSSALDIVRSEAEILAPKKNRILSKSIHVQIVESSRDTVWGEVGTDVEYALIQEFGGKVHQDNAWGIPGRSVDIVVPPHPYMRPAWTTKLTSMKNEVMDVLKILLLGPVS